MAKDGKSTATPRLRFPEFRGTNGWEKKKLSTLVSLISGVHLSPDQYSKEGENPYFTGPSDFTNEIEAISKRTDASASIAVEDDTLITVKGSGVGETWYLTLPSVVMGRQLMAVRAGDSSSSFIYQFLLTKKARFEALGSGNLIPGLSRGDILGMEDYFPSNVEQQKIADCLTSLDEVIAAQSRKLDVLKVHKRGLMRQVFPRKGETRPRFRFPEFRDAPEWQTRELGPMTVKVGSGITPLGGEKNYKANGRPFVRSQNIGWGELILNDVAYIDEETHRSFDTSEIEDSDVLLNITGASIGRSAVADPRIVGGNVNQHVCLIRLNKNELNPVLLNQYLISDLGQKQIDRFQAGGNRQGLNFGQIRTFEIPRPPTESEQEKVAACLSSLDALLGAQSHKLDSLRTHKKGLLQQLFPVPEEGL